LIWIIISKTQSKNKREKNIEVVKIARNIFYL